ncbi:MAG: cytochrome c biogenesis protein ResB [Desulfuromonadales bacterium]|nr:cytochrome c biogenesis protein ResB [Desulfuromonadales bacterium]
MKRILEIFSSVRLTMALLLVISVTAVGGTIWPFEQDSIQRFDIYYQSWWFRALLGLLALNLLGCCWRTFSRVWGERARLSQSLGNIDAEAHPSLDQADRTTLCARLEAQGYKLTPCDDRLLARRGASGRWALPVMHLAILAVMLGAWASQLGFVGTANVYVTHQTETYFDWSSDSEQPLGFSLRLDHFEPRYYPIDLRFAVIDPASRTALQEFTTTEGETVDLGNGMTALVQRFFPEEEHLVLQLYQDGLPMGEYHALSGQRNYPNPVRLSVEIRPMAFRDPLLKQLYSEVSILEGGEVVKQGVIEVNTPLVHRGVAIYQTTYNRDESGFWFCGFQMSKDPGEPVVWIGSIVLCLSLLLVFTLQFRAVGLIPSAQGWRLAPLAGFRGSEGKERFEGLCRAVGAQDLS